MIFDIEKLLLVYLIVTNFGSLVRLFFVGNVPLEGPELGLEEDAGLHCPPP